MDNLQDLIDECTELANILDDVPGGLDLKKLIDYDIKIAKLCLKTEDHNLIKTSIKELKYDIEVLKA